MARVRTLSDLIWCGNSRTASSTSTWRNEMADSPCASPTHQTNPTVCNTLLYKRQRRANKNVFTHLYVATVRRWPYPFTLCSKPKPVDKRLAMHLRGLLDASMFYPAEEFLRELNSFDVPIFNEKHLYRIVLGYALATCEISPEPAKPKTCGGGMFWRNLVCSDPLFAGEDDAGVRFCFGDMPTFLSLGNLDVGVTMIPRPKSNGALITSLESEYFRIMWAPSWKPSFRIKHQNNELPIVSSVELADRLVFIDLNQRNGRLALRIAYSPNQFPTNTVQYITAHTDTPREPSCVYPFLCPCLHHPLDVSIHTLPV